MTEIRKTIFESLFIFEIIMNDKYQDIIYREQVKLRLRLGEIDRQHRRTMLTLYLIFFILMICAVWLFCTI